MALDGTYSGMQASILEWADKSGDSVSVARVPDIITIFESQANRDAAIRTQFNRVSTTLTAVIGNNYVTPPTDFLGADALFTNYVNTTTEVKSYPGASQLYAQFPSGQSVSGQPKGFIVMAGKLEIAPTPDFAYPMPFYYYQKIPALASNTSGNWLSINYPEIYLFGCLVAFEASIGTGPDLQKWGDLYDNAIQQLAGSTGRNMYGGGGMMSRVDNAV